MKGLQRSLSRGPAAVQNVVRQTIRVTDLAVTVAGASGVGFGSAVIGDLPEGNILFLGAAAYLQFSEADADVTDTFTGNYAIGTTATADATLDTTDANIVASSSISAATAGVSPVTRGVGATVAMLDNTDGSLELNLNLTIADAAISGAGSMVADGYVQLVYVVLGDD